MRERGFTLLEVLVATLIMGLAVVGLPLGVVAGTQYRKPAGALISALSLVGIAVKGVLQAIAE